jgi:hypothetical protein
VTENKNDPRRNSVVRSQPEKQNKIRILHQSSG